ncbi:TPA: CBS domain-containing protein [Candidatus Woesearchaeota archaeon]|nr:CBS domain-containing protein [Candidatus Woesearchaeota archaeon]
MGLFDHFIRAHRRKKILNGVRTLRNLTVGEVMSRYVITVRPDDEVIKAATKMIAEDISCIAVVDNEVPVGIISERDILKRVPLSKKVFAMRVSEVMRKPILTVPPTMTLPEAMALMAKNSIRRLAVVENGKLAGLITQTDFTKAIAKNFQAYPVVPDLSVRNVMSQKIFMLPTNGTIAQAKDMMVKNDIGVIIIVDKLKDPQPLGIMTEYDIVMQFYDQQGQLELKDIKDYMRKYVRAVPVETSVFQTNKLMLEKNMRRALVVDGTKMVGIITQTTICRFFYPNLDLIEKAANDPKAELRKFSLEAEIHGEFHGEHLKVYDIG